MQSTVFTRQNFFYFTIYIQIKSTDISHFYGCFYSRCISRTRTTAHSAVNGKFAQPRRGELCSPESGQPQGLSLRYAKIPSDRRGVHCAPAEFDENFETIQKLFLHVHQISLVPHEILRLTAQNDNPQIQTKKHPGRGNSCIALVGVRFLKLLTAPTKCG